MADGRINLAGGFLVLLDGGNLSADDQGRLRISTAALGDLMRIKTISEEAYTDGQLLYVSGFQLVGTEYYAEVKLADATAGTAHEAVLVAVGAALLGATGEATNARWLLNQNTAAGAEGQAVYLSGTAGGWTLTPPTGATSLQQIIGFVAVVDAAVGAIRISLPESALPVHTHQDASRGGQVPTAGVVDGLFSADGAGRLKMSADFFEAAAVSRAKFADNFWDDDATILAKFGRGLQRDVGHATSGYFRAVGNVTAGDTITINARVYTFTAAPGGATDVDPGGAGPWAPDVAMARFTAVLNVDAGRSVDGTDWPLSDATSAGVSIIGKVITGGANLALSTTVAVPGAILRSGATTTGYAAAQSRQVWQGAYAVTADAVNAWLQHAAGHGGSVAIGTVASTTAAQHVMIFVRDSTGIIKLINTMGVVMRQVNANYFVVELVDDIGVLAATDEVSWIAWS